MHRSIFIFLILLFSHLLSGQQLITREGGHCYTLSVPEYMVKTYELNDVATLQYQNSAREDYVIVIEDPKDQLEDLGMHFVNANDFIANFLDEYKLESEKREVSEVSEFDVEGNHLAQAVITWTDEDNEFYMLVTAVETETYSTRFSAGR